MEQPNWMANVYVCMSVKTSLIISVYKNTLFLNAVLASLRYQTRKPDEVIVSEDGDSREMQEFLAGYESDLTLIHLTQKDRGWRKNEALNRAIVAASGDYLIFIDGDCVLHTHFIENHVRLACQKDILAGKRVKLGPLFSSELQKTPVPRFQRGILGRIRQLRKDGAQFVEEALYIPFNPLSNAIIRMLGISSIKGCNFSCYKEAMLAINGFDEDYTRPAVGEDIDLIWRFKGMGYRIVSVKHFAVQYHLYHVESWSSQEENMTLLRQKQASRQYRCLNGIEKLSLVG
ncbi:glycosyltransferase [Parapedobacter defluvii]|uniref:glycosyltransferase n=1 Tax=Parapedobacter defluvii TaxID=2045106 RepID=UPI0033423348